MVRRNAELFALLALGSIAACQTDHAALEQRPSPAPASAGASGALGTAGAPSHVIGGPDDDVSSGGGHADDEAPGKSVFTMLNGVVDAPSVLVCVAKLGAEGGVELLNEPLGAEPLAYGKSIVVEAIAGAAFESDTLQPVVIAGELDLIQGLDCGAAVARAESEQAIAFEANEHAAANAGGAGGSSGATSASGKGGTSGKGGANGAGGHGGTSGTGATTGGGRGAAAGNGGGGPTSAPNLEVRSRLRVGSLPAVPAGTLNAGRSILYVLTGCIGGDGYDAPNSASYCGAGYRSPEPTLSASLLSLSRKVASGVVGLQFVHASAATPVVSVSSVPPFPSTQPGVSIANNVVPGQASPRSALLSHTAQDYGVAQLYRLQLTAQGSPISTQSWADTLGRGGLSDLQNGSTYALVLVGPGADSPAAPLWNPAVISAIAVDPP